MSIFEKHRFKIFNQGQHPYKHTLGDFAFINERLPNISTLEDAMNYIVSFLYPNYKGTAATPGDLPLAASLNDYYVVTDDGDGKSAGYIYSTIDNIEQWIKRYDVDWSFDNILSETLLSTRPIYVHKWGVQDKDENAAYFVGDLAGQRIYGGVNADEHLIFYANSGDAVGNTGHIQFGDNSRPLVDSTFTSGTNLYRWLGVYTDNLYSGTMTIASGSITDSSGDITFDNENLLTTGTLGCGVLTAATGSSIGTMTIADGSITDSTGSITFDNENLLTTGTLGSGTITVSSSLILATGSITDVTGNITFDNENLLTTGTLGCGVLTATQLLVDDISINANTISVTTVDTNLQLSANGTGFINLTSNLVGLGITGTGTLLITGQADIDNIRIDGNTISSIDVDGNIILNPNGTGLIELGSALFPTNNSSDDIGKTGNVWNTLWVDGSIKDDTNTLLISELMTLRNILYRDSARTLPVQAGDTLFYDAVSGTWIANHPDTEITHSELSGLTTTDAGHTQFVMLTGRAGGQTVQGGTDASDFLDLESTAHATKGSVRVKDNFVAFTNASYGAGWSGSDLGDPTHYFRDIYTKGEAKGLRLENYLLAGIPASSAANVGRVVFITDKNKAYVDTGAAFVPIGNKNKFLSDIVFNGVELTKDIDVSANIEDARNAVKQLFDNTNNFELLFVKIESTSISNVRITTNIALPAGSYRLIVLE